jgi:hypothetical protein
MSQQVFLELRFSIYTSLPGFCWAGCWRRMCRLLPNTGPLGFPAPCRVQGVCMWVQTYMLALQRVCMSMRNPPDNTITRALLSGFRVRACCRVYACACAHTRVSRRKRACSHVLGRARGGGKVAEGPCALARAYMLRMLARGARTHERTHAAHMTLKLLGASGSHYIRQ